MSGAQSGVESGPLLEVAHLSTVLSGSDGPVRAVDDVSFSIAPGETFALIGESGSGKSMTALSLMRLLPEAGRIAGGSVRFERRDILALPEVEMRDVRGGAMAMIFQEPATSLNPVLTVGKQIIEVLDRHGKLSSVEARERASALLGDVGIPDPTRRLDDYPFELSGGMNQRVMIAIALAGVPRLLIADEPTTALDVTIQAQVLDLLAALQRKRGMAIFLISHDLGIVAQLAHQVAVMYAGQLVEVAPRKAFYASPRHPYSLKLFAALPSAERRGGRLESIKGNVPPLTRRFTNCRFADRCPSAWERCHNEAPAWHRVADHHHVRCHLFDKGVDRVAVREAAEQNSAVAGVARGNGPLLEVTDLTVQFPIRRGLFRRPDQLTAVDGVNLRLAQGRTLALVGESGCGKTTAGKAILQLIRPTKGAVRFNGTNLPELPEWLLRPLRRMMQIVFQNPFASLDPRMRVGEIIEEGMTALSVAAEKAARAAHIAKLLGRVGLSADVLGRYPHEFSGGQRQRIAIARALAVEPQLLICDEPTSALDVSVQAQILNLLKELQDQLGLSYLFITHNIAVVDYIAHEVAVMYLGRIVEQGPVEEVLRAPRHPYTEALLAAVPRVDGAERKAIVVKGDMPSRDKPPTGCHFHPRCPKAMDICRQTYPEPTKLSGAHEVRCYLYGG
ncbi:MAG: dipeptide ABC transporter ATP-binding protein [Xanthobacteraceae bacterium]